MIGGTAVAVGLPPLEAMLDRHGTAFAGGDEIPRRFGLWFFGNGVKRDRWVPDSVGTAWKANPPASLVPFADAGVLDHVSVVSRTWNPFRVGHAHSAPYWGLMTGSQPLDPDDIPEYDGDYPTHGEGPKAIDVIVDRIGGGTKFDRIDVGISRGASGADYLTGDTESSQWNPQALYQRLFADFMPTAEPPSPGLVKARRSVLDAVAADTITLRQKLGAADRQRLDEHLERIAAIEASLDSITAACTLPPEPGPRPDDLGDGGEPLEEVNEAMSSLVAYALACDLTRVFDYTFSRSQGYPHFWQVDAPEGHHELGHEEGGDQPKVQATIEFMMKQCATLVAKLAAIPVGDESLLDYCCIWTTSEHNEPNLHGTFDTPTLVIGKSGGALKGGVHHDAGGDGDWEHRFDKPEALHAGVVLTMMQALGIDAQSFGVGDGASSHVMTELMT